MTYALAAKPTKNSGNINHQKNPSSSSLKPGTNNVNTLSMRLMANDAHKSRKAFRIWVGEVI